MGERDQHGYPLFTIALHKLASLTKVEAMSFLSLIIEKSQLETGIYAYEIDFKIF